MAKAVAARIQGDDYQGRFFWIEACRMFDERSKVVKVEIESENVKSLDDVVVHYTGMFEVDQPIYKDFYQVKFHVTANGAFTWEGMMDPTFINATSVSLLQRLRDAQRMFAPDGRGCRFNIFSPWTVHPDDEMAKVLDQADGHMRWSVLSEGGSGSRMGKVRTAWREHLALASDEELRIVLTPVRIKHGPTLDDLARTMNLHLKVAGLRAIADGATANIYDDLARKLIQAQRTSFTRQDIEDICRREGLWVGRTVYEPEAVRLGIRSFWRFAENLEDETDSMLCLLHHFAGRAVKDASLWNMAIEPEIEKFLRDNTSSSRSYHLHLQTHGTIAFLAGRTLNPKSGVDIVPVQNSSSGRHAWRPEPITPDIEQRYAKWIVNYIRVDSAAGEDVALAISVTHNIEKDVLAYTKQNIIKAGHLIHCQMPAPGPNTIVNGTHAQMLAQSLVASVRELCIEKDIGGVLHIFFAVPNGVMFFAGRLSQCLGHLVLYEFDFDSALAGSYRSSWSSHAADLSVC